MPETEEESNLNELVGRVLGLITRRRWHILGTAFVVTMATIAVLLVWPNRYQSEATLLVVQQQVPERYVTPTTTTELADALQAMQREALSRSRLLAIIEEFGLYPKQSKRLAPEQLIELMLRNIEIEPLDANPQRKAFNSLRIAFTGDNPHVAQEVTSRLTSIFIEQNLKTREDQATTTTKFLHEQLEAAKSKLAGQEQRLRDFKMQYLGELPEQQQGNLGILTSLNNQLQNTMASVSRAEERRVYLESLLNGYRALGAARTAMTPAAPLMSPSSEQPLLRSLTPLEAAQSEVARLQAERGVLLRRFTPQHPDVRRNALDLAKAETVVRDLKAASPQAPAPTVASAAAIPTTPATPATPLSIALGDEPGVAQVKSQLEANRVEIQNLLHDEKQLKASLAQYQSRLNMTPVREQQLAGLERDYDLMKKEYADLMSKEVQSQLATTLEKRQEGLRFRLVDPPSLPMVPSSPKRVKGSLGGLAGGLALGIALAFVLEMKAVVFHTEKELKTRFPLPLVLGIPMLRTPAEKRSRSRRFAFEWLAGSALTLTMLLAEFYVYRHG